MDAKIKKMREKLAKHRQKIAEFEAQAVEMEREIKKAEEDQLGCLARFAANNLSGGIDEVFELLRGLREKPENHANIGGIKEGENVYDTDETEKIEG